MDRNTAPFHYDGQQPQHKDGEYAVAAATTTVSSGEGFGFGTRRASPEPRVRRDSSNSAPPVREWVMADATPNPNQPPHRSFVHSTTDHPGANTSMMPENTNTDTNTTEPEGQSSNTRAARRSGNTTTNTTASSATAAEVAAPATVVLVDTSTVPTATASAMRERRPSALHIALPPHNMTAMTHQTQTASTRVPVVGTPTTISLTVGASGAGMNEPLRRQSTISEASRRRSLPPPPRSSDEMQTGTNNNGNPNQSQQTDQHPERRVTQVQNPNTTTNTSPPNRRPLSSLSSMEKSPISTPDVDHDLVSGRGASIGTTGLQRRLTGSTMGPNIGTGAGTNGTQTPGVGGGPGGPGGILTSSQTMPMPHPPPHAILSGGGYGNGNGGGGLGQRQDRADARRREAPSGGYFGDPPGGGGGGGGGGGFFDDLVPQRPARPGEIPLLQPRDVKSRLRPTLSAATEEKVRCARKALLTGYALNVAIGLQVVISALITGLSAVTTGRNTSIMTSVLGGFGTIVASYLARARGSGEPEISIARTKDLEKFIRTMNAYIEDYGDEVNPERHNGPIAEMRDQFEQLLGNANGDRKMSTPV